MELRKSIYSNFCHREKKISCFKIKTGFVEIVLFSNLIYKILTSFDHQPSMYWISNNSIPKFETKWKEFENFLITATAR